MIGGKEQVVSVTRLFGIRVPGMGRRVLQAQQTEWSWLADSGSGPYVRVTTDADGQQNIITSDDDGVGVHVRRDRDGRITEATVHPGVWGVVSKGFRRK